VQRDLSCPVLWQESLRASQERRIKAARAETRGRVGRRGTAVALCGLAVMSGGAFAHERASSEGSAEQSAAVQGSSVSAAQEALGVTADGVYGPQTRRAVRSFQRSEGLSVDGVLGPQTLAALGVSGGGSSDGGSSEGGSSDGGGDSTTEETGSEGETETTGNSSSGDLEAIAQCESGGDPGAVSSTGQYRGKYQFSREAWRGVGGEGDPADASEAEQDRRAADLYEQSGSSSWPTCG